MGVAPLMFAPRPKLWSILGFNLVAYILLWGALLAEDLPSALLLAALVVAITGVAGMPYYAKQNAGDGVVAQIAVCVSVLAGLAAVYAYDCTPLIAMAIVLAVRVAVYTLGELIPPRKSSE